MIPSAMTPLGRVTGLTCVLTAVVLNGASQDSSGALPVIHVQIDQGHPWRPPFGLERIGRPLAAVVSASERPAAARYVLSVLSRGKEVGRHDVRIPGGSPLLCPRADRVDMPMS